jgi:hypothetical protein
LVIGHSVLFGLAVGLLAAGSSVLLFASVSVFTPCFTQVKCNEDLNFVSRQNSKVAVPEIKDFVLGEGVKYNHAVI